MPPNRQHSLRFGSRLCPCGRGRCDWSCHRLTVEVSAVWEMVFAFAFGEQVEDLAAELPKFYRGALSTVAEPFFEFAKGQLDRVQIVRVGRQIQHGGSGRPDRREPPRPCGRGGCPSPPRRSGNFNRVGLVMHLAFVSSLILADHPSPRH